LARKECDYDFQFTLHSSYQNDTSKITVIETALRHWSKLSGLTLVLERDSQGNILFDSLVNDNKNFIRPDPFISVMSAKPIFGVITINNHSYIYRTTGSHISINNIINFWNYDTIGNSGIGKISFYQAFMHELGHILLLGHVNNPSELMYNQIFANFPIINLTSTSTPVLAVRQTVEASRAIPWPAGFVKIPKITIVGDDSPLICNGRSATLTSNHATGNLWSTGETSQSIHVYSSGKYWLNIPGSDCGLADTVSLTFSSLNATFNVTHPLCFGDNTGTIVTNPTGTHQPFNFHWTGIGINTTAQNLFNLTAGTYNLQLSNSAGCMMNYPVTITQPAPLTVYFSQTPTTYEATVVGGTPPYSYQWSYEFVPLYQCPRVLFPNSPSILISYEKPPCFLQLTVTDANGCQVTGSPTRSKSMLVGEENKEIVIYPNPTTGNVTISNISDASIFVYSAFGALVKTFEHVFNNDMINLSNFANGIYFLKIINENNIYHKQLLIIKY